jgi:hypothetical protein
MLAFQQDDKSMLQPQFQNTRLNYVGVIDRKADEVRRWVSEHFDGTERYRILRAPNSIDLRIAISSPRAKDLFLKLHADVFHTFTPPTPMLQENGEWIAWLGFSEPLIPTNYVSIH